MKPDMNTYTFVYKKLYEVYFKMGYFYCLYQSSFYPSKATYKILRVNTNLLPDDEKKLCDDVYKKWNRKKIIDDLLDG